MTAAAVDMKLKNGLLSATKWLVDWITPLLSAYLAQYLCALCCVNKSGIVNKICESTVRAKQRVRGARDAAGEAL